MLSVNPWLIAVLVIAIVLILGGSVYLLCVFGSKEDRNTAWLPKGVVVLSVALSCFTVLLLPYDVANKADPLTFASLPGGMDVTTMWYICLIAIVVFCVLIIPFCIFYYESYDPAGDDGEGHPGMFSQILPAIGFTLATAIVFVVLLLALWFTVGYADIPYTGYACAMLPADDPAVFQPVRATCVTNSNAILSVQVSPAVYAIAMVGVAGWVLFVIFGGVGLTALPVDLVMEWWYRPRPVSTLEYSDKKQKVGARAQLLTLQGEKLQEEQRKSGAKPKLSLRRAVNKFKVDVEKLEAYYMKLEFAYRERGGSPWVAWFKLFLGIITFGISLGWIAHILAYNILNANPFLNNLFIKLDNCFALFGLAAYSVCTFYLLWATTKGVIKVGLNLLIFELHPMKVGDTLMNSFLVNCILVLVATVTVVQFAAMSFRAYAANTAVYSLFNAFISNLKGIGYVFRYFQYVLLAIAFLSILVGGVLCNRRRKDREREERELNWM
eukprot:RCo006536